MKKNTLRWWTVLAAVVAVYHVVIFAVPFDKTPVFYLSWGFTFFAMAAQVYVIRTAFYKGEGTRSKFYGFPIAKLGVGHLLAQLVLGLAFMAAGQRVATWIPLLIYVLLLAGTTVGLIAADTARDEVERQDAKGKADVVVMRALQSRASALPGLTKDARLGAELTKFAEALRFSDPVSNASLCDVENTLVACIDDLEKALTEGNVQRASFLLQKAMTTLNERNRLCKLNKGDI